MLLRLISFCGGLQQVERDLARARAQQRAPAAALDESETASDDGNGASRRCADVEREAAESQATRALEAEQQRNAEREEEREREREGERERAREWEEEMARGRAHTQTLETTVAELRAARNGRPEAKRECERSGPDGASGKPPSQAGRWVRSSIGV